MEKVKLLFAPEKKNSRQSPNWPVRIFKLAIVACIIIFTLGTSILELHLMLLPSEGWVRIRAGKTIVEKSFLVAAYEQKIVSAENVTTREEALVAMRANLANIQEQAGIASRKGVDFLVLAEYGITGDMGMQYMKRSSIYPYMEKIPAVSISSPACASCNNVPVDPRREGQITIGCLARKYKMYVLANLIEFVPCDIRLDSQCPSDGHYQYNTNIVYNPKGCLIAKYHKFHRFAEEFERLDRPTQPEYVYFDTEYGRFGTMICMDAMFQEPGLSLAKTYGIDHMLFSTYYESRSVVQLAVSWQLAFATIANVNFIGANIHSEPDHVYGSSILSGSKVISYSANYSSSQGALVIGELPTSKPPYSQPIALDDDQVVDLPTISWQGETAEIDHDIYNVVVLEELAGSAHVCQDDICCSVEYIRDTTNETYILAAFEGLHTFQAQFAFQICLLYKCRNESLSSCGQPELASATSFSHLKLAGKFGVHYVYPNLVPSDLEYQKLNCSFQHYNFENKIVCANDWPLVSVALVGRNFQKDPHI